MNLEIFKSFMSHVNILFPLLKKKKKRSSSPKYSGQLFDGVCLCVHSAVAWDSDLSQYAHTC